MAEHFSFANATGEFRIVRSEDELVPGSKYLYESYGRVVRRVPFLVKISQFIMKFDHLEGDTLVFDSPDFAREGSLENHEGVAVLNPYEPFGEWRPFPRGIIPDKRLSVTNMRNNTDIQIPGVNDLVTYRLFHLPAEAKLISPSIPPKTIEEVATSLARVKKERNLPSAVTAEITSYLGAPAEIIRVPGWVQRSPGGAGVQGGVETPGNNSSGGRKGKSKKGKSKKGKSKKGKSKKSKSKKSKSKK